MQLRDYQREAVDSLYSYFAEHDGNPLLVLPTGAGKSVIQAAFQREVMARWPDQRILLLTHVRELIQQNAAKLLELWPSAPLGMYAASLKKREGFMPVVMASIQSVHNKADVLGRFDLIIIDECHLVPRTGTTMYRRFLDAMRELNPAVKIIGMSATPFRLDSGYLHKGKDRIFTDIAYEVPIRQLIDGGYLCNVITKGALRKINTDGVRTRAGEFVTADLETAVHADGLTEAAIAEILRYGEDRQAWLVFCPSVAHAQEVADLLNQHVPTACLHGGTPREEREDIVAGIRSGALRCVTNCDVLTTGFDAPVVDLIAFLRPTQSAALYIQMCLDSKTEILTKSGWKGIGQISKGDQVAALDLTSGLGAWSKVLNTVDRETVSAERFVSISTNRLDLRVTDMHDMVFASRTNRGGYSEWKKQPALELASRKHMYRIPSAVQIDAKGVPLTDHELRFLGLFMTDGSLNKATNAVVLYQSERYPEVLRMIRATLKGCGFKYGEHIRSNDVAFGKRRKYPMHLFTISKGRSRGRDKHLRGWGNLEPYLSKDFAEPLLDCTKEQTRILLEAVNAGDGVKSAAYWTRRGYSVSTGNRLFADRLQMLCVLNGFSANVVTQTAGRVAPIIYVHISPHAFRAVGGAGDKDRGSLAAEPESRERVWCVETEHGTILTRRNGKVAVMGNCGRGMRTAPGKTDCLVLDFAGNVQRHGPIDAVEVSDKRKAAGEAGEKLTRNMGKECPRCQAVVSIFARECGDCGHIWPAVETPKHDATAHSGAILTSQIAPEWVAVKDVFYRRHQKPGKPDSMRVDYQCGLIVHSEWVCVEHEGYARQRAEAWYSQRGLPCPPTVTEALNGRHRYPKPDRVRVRRSGKYTEVVAVDVARVVVSAMAPGIREDASGGDAQLRDVRRDGQRDMRSLERTTAG